LEQGGEVDLSDLGSELMELEVTLDIGKAREAGIKVNYSPGGEEETIVYYDAQQKLLKFDTTKSNSKVGERAGRRSAS